MKSKLLNLVMAFFLIMLFQGYMVSTYDLDGFYTINSCDSSYLNLKNEETNNEKMYSVGNDLQVIDITGNAVSFNNLQSNTPLIGYVKFDNGVISTIILND